MTLLFALRNNILKESNLKKKIIYKLADLINYIHDQKMIHRSIKPSNIFLDKNMNLKLGDFGDPIHDNCFKCYENNPGDVELKQKDLELSEKFTQKV